MSQQALDSWFEQQLEFWRQIAAGAGAAMPAGCQQKLAEMGRQFAALSAEFWRPFATPGSPAADPVANLQAIYHDAFRQALGSAPLDGPDHTHPVAALARLQRALQQQGELLGSVAADATQRFMATMATTAPATLDGLHQRWLECGEQAWAGAAGGDAWCQAQQELVAALTEWLASQQAALDGWNRALGRPTGAELDELYRELQQLRRRVRELEVPSAGSHAP